MMRYVSLGVLFIVLYMSFVWLFIYIFSIKQSKRKPLEQYPMVTLCVPCYKEKETIKHTLDSIQQLNYPKNKIEVYVIENGAQDGTQQIVDQHDLGTYYFLDAPSKAKAVNLALAKAKGEFFSVVDADSTLSPNALIRIIEQFNQEKKNVACIISAIKISNTKKLLAKVQEIEYTVSILVRQLMSDINVLQFAHGVLSVNKTSALKKIGGFDPNNLTEDYEMAVKLRFHGYQVKSCAKSIVYTKVPETLKGLWAQRIRWFRGYLQTIYTYKAMIGNSKYAALGWFQMPLNVVAPLIVLSASIVIAINVTQSLYSFLFRFILVDGYFSNLINSIPNMTQVLLTLQAEVLVPIIITTLVGIIMAMIAFRFITHTYPKPWPMLFYLFVFPPFTMAQWVWATTQQIIGARKKW